MKFDIVYEKELSRSTRASKRDMGHIAVLRFESSKEKFKFIRTTVNEFGAAESWADWVNDHHNYQWDYQGLPLVTNSGTKGNILRLGGRTFNDIQHFWTEDGGFYLAVMSNHETFDNIICHAKLLTA